MLQVGTQAEPSASFQGIICRQDPGREASPMAMPDSDPGGGTVSCGSSDCGRVPAPQLGLPVGCSHTVLSTRQRSSWGQERSRLTFGHVQATLALATQGKACAFTCVSAGTPLSVNTRVILRPLPADASMLELSPQQALLYLPSCRGEPAAGQGRDICWGTSSNLASPRFYLEKAIGISSEAAVEQTRNRVTRGASTPGPERLFLFCWTTGSMKAAFLPQVAVVPGVGVSVPPHELVLQLG